MFKYLSLGYFYFFRIIFLFHLAVIWDPNLILVEKNLLILLLIKIINSVNLLFKSLSVYIYKSVCVCAQSCLTFCSPMDCSLPGSSTL